ncbi:MAG: DUF2946 family protein [Rhodospirillaceae bacterium]
MSPWLLPSSVYARSSAPNSGLAEKGRVVKRGREALRQWGLGLALCAMLLQVLVPVAQAIPVTKDGLPSWLVICTLDGVQSLTSYGSGSDLGSAELPPAEPGLDRLFSCPVCLAVAAADIEGPTRDAGLVPPPSLVRFRAVAPGYAAVPQGRQQVALPPVRGPPLF